MGTNYYVAENSCDCCNRYDEAYHIGKSSVGWAFSFRGYRPERLVSWTNWKEFLKDKDIRDEYGQRVNYEWFVHMIETVKSPGHIREDGQRNLVHNQEGRASNWFNPEYDWDDDQGYSFSSREFS